MMSITKVKRSKTISLILSLALILTQFAGIASAGGIVSTAPETNLQFLGHETFVLTTSNGTKIVTDPGDMLPVGALDAVNPTAVTVSHVHPDHYDPTKIAGVNGVVYGTSFNDKYFLQVNQGFGDVVVSNVYTNHFEETRRGNDANSVFNFDFGVNGVKIMHVGDPDGTYRAISQHLPGAEQQLIELKAKAPDVLLLNVDPQGQVPGISVTDIVYFIDQLQPKVVIPMHLGYANEDPSGFVNWFTANRPGVKIWNVPGNSLNVSKLSLPQTTQIWVIPPGAYSATSAAAKPVLSGIFAAPSTTVNGVYKSQVDVVVSNTLSLPFNRKLIVSTDFGNLSPNPGFGSNLDPQTVVGSIYEGRVVVELNSTNVGTANITAKSLDGTILGTMGVQISADDSFATPPSPTTIPSITAINDVVSGDQFVNIVGQNLYQVVAGAVYSGTNKVADLTNPMWEGPVPGSGILHMNLGSIQGILSPGSYVMQLVYGGEIVGGQTAFQIVPQGGMAPQYNVGPSAALPGESFPLEIFGPNLDSTTSVEFFAYSSGAWTLDTSITQGNIEPLGDRIRVPISVAAGAAIGPRKIVVNITGQPTVEIIDKFKILNPMKVAISGNDIIINPNGNQIGTDPANLILRFFNGGYPTGEMTSGFSINTYGNIVVPLDLKPELQFAQAFTIEVIKSSEMTLLGRGNYIKPNVGPSTVMPGSMNIPLDIWAPGLTVDSFVYIKVFNGGTWNLDPDFVIYDSTREIVPEPNNVVGGPQHYRVMMTVKDAAYVGSRRIEVTGPGAVVIDNAFNVMPNMYGPGTGGEVPFMVGGSNVEEMGTVSPAIQFIGVGFTRPVVISDANRINVKNAIQIQKLVNGVVSGTPIDGVVANPLMPKEGSEVPESNVVLFKPAAPLDASSAYRLTIAQGSITSTEDINSQPLSSTYSVDFNTGTLDTTAPSIVKMDTMPSPTEGAILFQFDKPMNEQEVTDLVYYDITVPRAPGGTLIVKYDPMMNMVKIVGYNLAIGDRVTGVVYGLHSAAGVGMATPYNINATVQGFQMGTGTMTNTQAAFSPVEVKPTNPSANAESHYFIRFPIPDINKKLSAGDTIEIVFPAGFNVTSAVIDSNSPMNKDINGPGPGTVTVRSVSADNFSRLVTVTLNNDTGDKDFIQFELKGIINGPAKQITFDPNTGLPADGYYCVIKTKSGGTVKEGPMNSMLFPISAEVSGSITGNIKNSSGAGIANVKLYLDGPNGRKEGLSGTGGAFNFTGLAPGGYYLSTEPAPGNGSYVGITMPLKFFIDVFDADQIITGGDIVLDSTTGGAIAYYSVDVNITGPASKVVDVFAGSPTSFYVQTLTLNPIDSITGTGVAHLKVKQGNYMIGVGPSMPKGGFTGPAPIIDWMPPMPTMQEINGDRTGLQAISITIDTPNATITGMVKDSNNNPIPNANVHAYSPSGNTMGAGTITDSSGVYSLKVKAGDYTVGVNAPGMPWLPEKRVTVVDNQTLANVNFIFETLERTISGTVTDSVYRPISKASVVAYRVDSGDINTAKPLPGFANATTDSSGNFTLFVKPDSYWMLAGFAPEFGELQKQIVYVGESNISGKRMTVASNDMGTVQGTVYAGGERLANATIWAEGVNVPFGNKAVTNTNGDFSLKLKAGNYMLHLWTPETGEIPLDPEVKNITVTASSTLIKPLNLPQKGVITINFGTQDPGFEAFVHAKSANQQYQFENSGFVKLKGIGSEPAVIKIPVPVPDEGLTYNLFIAVPGMGDSNTIPAFAGMTAHLTVGAPKPTVQVTMPTSNIFTLSGTVTGTDNGLGVSNAWVHITQKGAPFGGTKKTDGSGNFSFDVPSGTYVLMVDHPDYMAKPPVIVTVNGATVQNLLLDPPAGLTISGTLYKDNTDLAVNKVTSNAVVWATDETGKFANGVLNSDGTYSISVNNGIWTVQAAGDGYETLPLNRQRVTVGGGSPTGINVIMTRLKKANGEDYEIKPPKTEPITPAVGGVLDDPLSKVKIIVPANALGSSVDAGQITAKETTGIPTTPLAKPAGNVGKEIKAADASGSAITKLNDFIEIVITYAELLDPTDATKLMDGTPIDTLQLGYWDESAKNWVFIPSTNDTTNKILRGKVDHLTTFAPLVATGESAPAAPAGLTAQASGSTGINLSWTAVTGATAYNIYRSATADGQYTKINSSQITAASYADTGLSSSTTYFYKVTAVNGAGESAASTAASAATASGGGTGGYTPSGSGTTQSAPDVEQVISNPSDASSVKTTDGSVELAIAPGTFSAASGEQIKVTIDKVETAAVNQILAKSTQPVEIKLIGNVFEFDALSVKSGTSTAVTSFTKPVSVKLSFSGANVNDPKKLGVYRLDEAAGKWEYVGGKVDAASKTVTVSLLHFSKYAILAYDKTFADVTTHWAKSDVEVAAARHFVSGVNDNSFAPDKNVTRAEFAVMLVKALGLSAGDQKLGFKDVKKGDWYYGSVAAAVKAGIISGLSSDTFAPNAKITREQMASMIARAMKAKGITTSLSQEEINGNINRFTDGKAVADWAKSDVAAVYSKSIIKGRNTGDFAPKATAVRAEAAVMLNRLFDLV